MAQQNYSETNLLQFIRQSAVSGLINPSTSVSRKKAAEHLLTQLNTVEKQDLRQLDVDELCSRFHKLQGSTIREESLEIYKDRLKATLVDFIAWVDDPVGFVPGHTEHVGSTQKNANRPLSTAAEKAKEELRKAGYEWDDQGRLYYPAPENDRRWIDSVDHYKSYETHSITWRKK